ncbi:MAG: asparagine synthase (glutamine-hydrolyzing), partial [Thermoplasmata archaeon]
MCRIVGFLDFSNKNNYNLERVITSMRDTLIYGGPDDAGNFIDQSNNLALGHRRLSIIDLSITGHQPMEFDNYVIVYNGEIYNFIDIKKELEALGYKFYSTSDTEVILKAFHRWGFKSVDKFRGMFAFAIWDKKDHKLILCRDRVGVKPLYYYYNNDLFMFASELKAFHMHPKFIKNISFEALSLYLQYGYITAPYSIFENTYKLEPGQFLVLDGKGKIEKFNYWNVDSFFKNPLGDSEESITQELELILEESFKLRLVSDVPIGVFLSGGIDSSTVAALLQKNMSEKLKTFTIGFYEKDYNEANYAKKIANYLGTDHTEVYITAKEAFDVISKIPEIYDEPFGDSSAIPTYLVSKLAKSKVKVSLSADGGDEQFCGYTRYWAVGNTIKIINKFKLMSILSTITTLINPEVAFRIYKVFMPLLPKWNNFRDKYIKLRAVLKNKDTKKQ